MISHALTGASLTGIIVKKPTRKQLVLGGLLALVPDIDTFVVVLGREYYLEYHRVVLHSFVVMLLLAPLLAWILSYRSWFRFGQGLLVTILALSSHLILDTMTSWGTALLFPILDFRYALNIVFMFDLWYPLLMAGLITYVHIKNKDRTFYLAASFLGTSYFVLSFLMKQHSQDLFRRELKQRNIETSNSILMVAQPRSPFTWAALVATNDTVYYGVKPHFSNSFNRFESRPITPETANLIKASETKSVLEFKKFAQYPWVEYQEKNEGPSYRWLDLSKEISGIERSNLNFSMRVDFDHAGNIIYEGFNTPKK